MARAMWKASLQLGGAEIPVKLYAAVEDRDVRFRLLHRDDGVPVEQRMVDPRDGREVPAEEVRRGLEVAEGRFVVLSGEELAALEPAPSRTIELLRFVPAGAIDVAWYERPYFLGPDGSGPDYFALAAALAASGRRGIARWAMRRKRYLGALEARGPYLALVTLRTADEVVPADRLPQPEGTPIREAERKLAEQLVATLDAPFEPALLRDEYRERVLALVRAKAEGRAFAVEEAPPPPPAEDLTDALRRSVRAAKDARRAA